MGLKRVGRAYLSKSARGVIVEILLDGALSKHRLVLKRSSLLELCSPEPHISEVAVAQMTGEG